MLVIIKRSKEVLQMNIVVFLVAVIVPTVLLKVTVL